MKVVSTFSGCGGSSTGYKMAGAEVLGAVEWEGNAVACYRENHPNTTIFHTDICKLTAEEVMNTLGIARGELDLLDGSPPCQGFSTSGRRVLDDPRNALFQQQMRLVREIQPKCVVLENVAGMIRGKMKKVAFEVIESLESLGYHVNAGLARATWFGVAQLRPRVFFVGSRERRPDLPEATHRHFVSAGRALAGVIPDPITPPVTAPSVRLFLKHARPGENGMKVFRRLGLKRDTEFNRILIDPRKPSPTIPKINMIMHWERRYLAPNEALVLTGFPEDYKLVGKYRQQIARVGNSVCPPVSCAIARSLMAQGLVSS